MNQKQRLSKILELLEERNQLSQEEIVNHFSISKDTARRDILLLTEQELVDRFRGGISLPTIKAQIEKYTERLVSHAREKEAIAKKAINFIKDHDTIMLDVSTTVQFISKLLIQEDLLVVTHSIDNAISTSENQRKNKVFLLGGYFNPDSHLLYGSSIEAQLNNFYFDIAFIGASGLTNNGLFYSEFEDIQVKKAIIQNSKKVCVVIDSSKIMQTTAYKLDLEGIDVIITDSKVPSSIQEKIDSYGIELVILNKEEKE